MEQAASSSRFFLPRNQVEGQQKVEDRQIADGPRKSRDTPGRLESSFTEVQRFEDKLGLDSGPFGLSQYFENDGIFKSV